MLDYVLKCRVTGGDAYEFTFRGCGSVAEAEREATHQAELGHFIPDPDECVYYEWTSRVTPTGVRMPRIVPERLLPKDKALERIHAAGLTVAEAIALPDNTLLRMPSIGRKTLYWIRNFTPIC